MAMEAASSPTVTLNVTGVLLEEKSAGDAAEQDAGAWAGWWRSTRTGFDPRDDIERIKQAANELVEYSLDLIAISSCRR